MGKGTGYTGGGGISPGTGTSGTTTGAVTVNNPPPNIVTSPSMPEQMSSTSMTLSPEAAGRIAALATQEDRGGVAGPNTALQSQMATLSTRLASLEATVAKLVERLS